MSSAAVVFATSLLWGGNASVQDGLIEHLESHHSQCFLRTFSDKVQRAVTNLQDWKRESVYVAAKQPEDVGRLHTEMLRAKKDLMHVERTLRLLQLLCEGHHLPLQNYLREQVGCSNPVNIVNDVMMFLKEVLYYEMDDRMIEVWGRRWGSGEGV